MTSVETNREQWPSPFGGPSGEPPPWDPDTDVLLEPPDENAPPFPSAVLGSSVVSFSDLLAANSALTGVPSRGALEVAASAGRRPNPADLVGLADQAMQGYDNLRRAQRVDAVFALSAHLAWISALLEQALSSVADAVTNSQTGQILDRRECIREEVAAGLRIAPEAASTRVAHAQTLCAHLPQTFNALATGTISPAHARANRRAAFPPVPGLRIGARSTMRHPGDKAAVPSR